MRLPNPATGFKYAVEGVVHVYRTQKHMRFHFFMLALVLMVSLAADWGAGTTLVLLLTVSLVLITEMFNTAVEAVVDLVTQTYHPLAKFAKDIAAGAVLMATINALAVGVILLVGNRDNLMNLDFRNRLRPGVDLGIGERNIATIALVGALLLLTLVFIRKVRGGKGTLLRGGIVSGHTALGFFFAWAIVFIAPHIVVQAFAFLLALLIAQSRVDAGIHSMQEVIMGGLLGSLVGLAVFFVK